LTTYVKIIGSWFLDLYFYRLLKYYIFIDIDLIPVLICFRGSQDIRLAILTSKKLVIYSLILNQGSVEHGLYNNTLYYIIKQ